jgi:hypothetical protein
MTGNSNRFGPRCCFVLSARRRLLLVNAFFWCSLPGISSNTSAPIAGPPPVRKLIKPKTKSASSLHKSRLRRFFRLKISYNTARSLLSFNFVIPPSSHRRSIALFRHPEPFGKAQAKVHEGFAYAVGWFALGTDASPLAQHDNLQSHGPTRGQRGSIFFFCHPPR